VSGVEDPTLLERAERGEITAEDLRALTGASTPHFALQLSERLARILAVLPEDHPARPYGEQQLELLRRLAFAGESRDERPPEAQADGEPALPSLAG
jgi:hypothetical protein